MGFGLMSRISLNRCLFPGMSQKTPNREIAIHGGREQYCKTTKDTEHQHSEKNARFTASSQAQFTQQSTPTLLMFLNDSDSGIDWMWAVPAINLLLDAKTLASSPSVIHQAKYIRRMSLDAITYLLKSLPENLTTEERGRIAECLPNKLILEASGVQVEDENGTDPTRSRYPKLRIGHLANESQNASIW